MDSLDVRKSVISQEDMADCTGFVSDFCEELKEYKGRLACTEAEKACARAIRNRLHDETDVKTRLEAFDACYMLGRRTFLLVGIWYAFCLALYYISFAGDRTVGAIITAISSVLFVLGTAMLMSLYLGSHKFKWLLGKKTTYNVVSECGSGDNRKVVIVCAGHDEMPGSAVRDFDLMRNACVIVAPISALVFLLFCILKMAMGTHDGDIVAKTSAFAIVPAIFGILGVAACIMHYSQSANHSRSVNGISTAVALASFAYFVDKPELMPSGVKLVFASFGAENAGHSGSKAFISSHPEFAGATVICIGNIASGNLNVVECDPLRKLDYNPRTVSALLSSAREQNIHIGVQSHVSLKDKFYSMHGFISNAFAKANMSTLTILAKRNPNVGNNPGVNDVENLFSITVGTLRDVMIEGAKEVKEDNDFSAIEIVEVQSK